MLKGFMVGGTCFGALAACFVGASFFASSSRKRALKVAAVFFCFGGTVSCVNDTIRNMG